MKTKNEKTKCPEIEVLSLYYDGLLDKESVESIHISACPKCLAKIESYGRIDGLLDDALSLGLDPSFTEKVKKAVHGKLDEAPKFLSYSYLLARAASVMFVIFASVFFVKNLYYPPMQEYDVDQYAITGGMGSTQAEQKSDFPSPGEIKTQKARNNTASPPGGTDKKTIENHQNPSMNEVPVSDVSLVSTGADDSIRFSDADSGKEKPAPIDKIVHHVWAVKDVEDAKKKIGDLITSISQKDSLRARKKNVTTEKFVLKKIDKQSLVDLIKRLSGEGFKLLTPEQPQPENNIFQGKPDEPVKYYFELVKS